MRESEVWEFYRYIHADGSAKDWACTRMTDGSGLWKVRWGKAGHLTGRQQGLTEAVIQSREREKLGKGYRSIGEFCIDARGVLYKPLGTLAIPTNSGPPKTAPKPSDPIDIAKLLGGGAGFYF
jgi:hypothetical protein